MHKREYDVEVQRWCLLEPAALRCVKNLEAERNHPAKKWIFEKAALLQKMDKLDEPCAASPNCPRLQDLTP